MIFREMTQEDIDFVKDHSASRGIFNKMPQQIEFCYALEHEDKILAIGGITLINLTTAWCWLDMTCYAGNHIIVVYRVVKEWLNKLAEDKKLKRLQCYVEPDFPEAIRMVKHLGFKYEYPMPSFIGDKPALMFARII